MFVEVIVKAVKTAFPQKTIEVKQTNSGLKWFSSELKAMREEVDAFYQMACLLKDQNSKQNYKFAKRYRAAIQQAKKAAHDAILKESSNKARDAWKIINNYRRAAITTGECTITPDNFNDYFVNIVDNITREISVNDNQENYWRELFKGRNTCSSFNFVEVTIIQVREAIFNLKNSKSKDMCMG